MRNDVERLRNLGYPVHATRGAAGGYRLGAGASLPPLLLDDEEAVAVAVGLRTAAGGTVSGIEETSLRALAKLEQVLPHRLRRRVNALQTYTVPVPGQEGPRVDAEVLTAIAAACRDHERLRFDYRDHSGAPTLRNVEPYRMVNWGRRWYLVAWDTQREDWRTFRVDRIAPRTPTGPCFTPRDLPSDDIAEYVSSRVAAAPWRTRARIVVHASAAEISGRIPGFAGTIEPIDDNSCVFSTGSDNPQTLAVWLGMLGADFTVEDAPELVEHLRALYRAVRPRRVDLTPKSPPSGERLAFVLHDVFGLSEDEITATAGHAAADVGAAVARARAYLHGTRCPEAARPCEASAADPCAATDPNG